MLWGRAGVSGFTSGPNGTVWFMENTDYHIGMINTTTDVITEFALPSALVAALASGRSRRIPTATSGLPRTTRHTSVRSTRRLTAISEIAISSQRLGNHVRSRRQHLVHRKRERKIGEINPTTTP